jgi:DNA-binding MarR family transcriptional regulator
MNDFQNEVDEATSESEADGRCRPRLEIPIARGSGDRIAFQLVVVGQLIEELGDSRLESSGVDSTGYCILATLSVDTPPSQHELARLMNKAPGVIVAEIDRLEAGGLVQRNRDPQDRRRSRVTLTAAGTKVLTHADEIADRVIAELFAGLDDSELAQLKALMNKGLGVVGVATA